MNVWASLAVLVAFGATSTCAVNTASQKQQRALEHECRCACVRVQLTLDTWTAYVNGDHTLTMAWGGGMWRCAIQSTETR